MDDAMALSRSSRSRGCAREQHAAQHQQLAALGRAEESHYESESRSRRPSPARRPGDATRSATPRKVRERAASSGPHPTAIGTRGAPISVPSRRGARRADRGVQAGRSSGVSSGLDRRARAASLSRFAAARPRRGRSRRRSLRWPRLAVEHDRRRPRRRARARRGSRPDSLATSAPGRCLSSETTGRRWSVGRRSRRAAGSRRASAMLGRRPRPNIDERHAQHRRGSDAARASDRRGCVRHARTFPSHRATYLSMNRPSAGAPRARCGRTRSGCPACASAASTSRPRRFALAPAQRPRSACARCRRSCA